MASRTSLKVTAVAGVTAGPVPSDLNGGRIRPGTNGGIIYEDDNVKKSAHKTPIALKRFAGQHKIYKLVETTTSQNVFSQSNFPNKAPVVITQLNIDLNGGYIILSTYIILQAMHNPHYVKPGLEFTPFCRVIDIPCS